ncbi:MAG: branched-chain amino acid transaminase [Mycoplasmatales bacterium]
MDFSKYGKKIWMDGKLVDPQDANISVMSHVVHYGSGFFEGIKAFKTANGPAIFRLDEHVDRLFYSARVYYYEIPFTKEEIKQAIIDTVKVNEFESCYIRPSIFMGAGWHDIDISEEVPFHVVISTWNLGDITGKEHHLGVTSYRRVSSQMTPMQAKAINNYMNSYLIRHEAHMAGYNEAIALDANGYVSESSGSNIFLVKDKKIITPSPACSILNGITRLSLIQICQDLGFEVEETFITRDFLHLADEVFCAGTATDVKAVNSIDRITVGTGDYPITEKILQTYLEIATGKNEKYQGWLTYVK